MHVISYLLVNKGVIISWNFVKHVNFLFLSLYLSVLEEKIGVLHFIIVRYSSIETLPIYYCCLSFHYISNAFNLI